MIPSETKQHHIDRPTVVDLFSGAGGTGLGFKQAGFEIIGAIEIDLHAATTYEKNLGISVEQTDIRELSPKTFREKLRFKRKQLDVMVGCPPCQGFTRMRNDKGANDKRNDLVLRYLDYIKEFMPRFAVFENVPGLIRTGHGRKYFKDLVDGLEELGYEAVWYEIDAVSYGVPQYRKRVIVVAARDHEHPPFPKETHGPPDDERVTEGTLEQWLTVRDAIGNDEYPAIEAGENGEQKGKYPNHVAANTGSSVLSFIKMVPANGGSRTDVEEQRWLDCHKNHNGHKDVYGRIAWDRPANTITTGCTNPSKGRFVHPSQDRAITAREAAVLQGFPPDYRFYGYKHAEQIGNAVPPPLAYAIANVLRDRIVNGSGD